MGPGHDTTIGERILGAEDNGEHEEPRPPCGHAYYEEPPPNQCIISGGVNSFIPPGARPEPHNNTSRDSLITCTYCLFLSALPSQPQFIKSRNPKKCLNLCAHLMRSGGKADVLWQSRRHRLCNWDRRGRWERGGKNYSARSFVLRVHSFIARRRPSYFAVRGAPAARAAEAAHAAGCWHVACRMLQLQQPPRCRPDATSERPWVC